MNRKAALPGRVDYDSFEWTIAIGVSFLIHIVLAAVFFVCSMSFNENTRPLHALDVDLAYLPPSKGRPDASEKSAVPPVKTVVKEKPIVPEKPAPVPEPEKKIIKVVKKAVTPEKVIPTKNTAVPIKTKDKDKVVPSKKEPSPQDEINKAIKQLEKNPGAPPPTVDPIAERLKRLAKETKDTGPRGIGGTSDKPNGGAVDLSLIDRYRAVIGLAIKANWAFSQNLAGGRKNLVTKVSFQVMPNGEISGIKIDKRSGNDYMDSSATMAIIKSSPVKPHPPGINKPYIEVKLSFTPDGLN